MMLVVLALLILLISFQMGYLLDPSNTNDRGFTGFLLCFNLHSLFNLLNHLS